MTSDGRAFSTIKRWRLLFAELWTMFLLKWKTKDSIRAKWIFGALGYSPFRCLQGAHHLRTKLLTGKWEGGTAQPNGIGTSFTRLRSLAWLRASCATCWRKILMKGQVFGTAKAIFSLKSTRISVWNTKSLKDCFEVVCYFNYWSHWF